jgi:methylaspartate ammonia-lyase
MTRHITAVTWLPAEAAFFTDDQAAIRAGASRDGFRYVGEPVTAGFHAIREPGRAVTVFVHLDDGAVVAGDCVAVQYSGVGGRAQPFSTDAADALLADRVRPALTGAPVGPLRDLTARLRDLALPPWLSYGVSQALLRARAHHRTMASVIADEWRLPEPRHPVPVFAQSGEAIADAVDRMIIKRVDALPHGLINNVDAKLGRDGARLHELVRWLRDRVRAVSTDPGYRPVFHFDVYGTLGHAFGTTAKVADYVQLLEAAAVPFRLRLEHPVDAGGRDAQIDQLAALREALRHRGSTAELVADEWCNTLADIELFAAAHCVDMIHVKTPDVGAVDDITDALLACKRAGVQAYCGGTCNETVGSAQVCAHLAVACAADLILAKPGMGVDEGLSLVRNEMRAAIVLSGHRGSGTTGG